MPISYLRRLTGTRRSPEANWRLARYLAFVAGAINAGGFLAVHQYTSHMSGIVAAMADNLAVGSVTLALGGLAALLSFIAGAACTAVMVNWARRARLRSEYALPLMLEAVLLLCFGLLGGNLERHEPLFVPATVMVLCFIMGLQNALITKVSRAEIRTTHITGMVTDIGIELGKLFYWNGPRHTRHMDCGSARHAPVLANRFKLRVLTTLVALFFVGGVLGALGFKALGFSMTLLFAALLGVLAVVPIVDDMRLRARRVRRGDGAVARLRRWAAAIKVDVLAVWLAARDPRTPWRARVLALLVAAYALSPIDLIPDFIPVLGYLDEALLIPLGILLVVRLVPRAQMEEHRAAARLSARRPVSWASAAVFVGIWLLLAGVCAGWFIARMA